MEKKSRGGFTLIELFLFIVVIVILAGAIMVSGNESVVSAEADNIINNMRIIKTAALEWIADHGDYIEPITYKVTYPYPAIMPDDKRNVLGVGIPEHIQNMLKTSGKEVEWRKTLTNYNKELFNKIQFQEFYDGTKDTKGKTDKPYAPQDGYAIVDPTGGYNNVDNYWPGDRSKWYVVYHFDENSKRTNYLSKLKKKIAGRAEEFGLYKNNKDNKGDHYTEDAKFVYMEIIDFTKK